MDSTFQLNIGKNGIQSLKKIFLDNKNMSKDCAQTEILFIIIKIKYYISASI